MSTKRRLQTLAKDGPVCELVRPSSAISVTSARNVTQVVPEATHAIEGTSFAQRPSSAEGTSSTEAVRATGGTQAIQGSQFAEATRATEGTSSAQRPSSAEGTSSTEAARATQGMHAPKETNATAGTHAAEARQISTPEASPAVSSTSKLGVLLDKAKFVLLGALVVFGSAAAYNGYQFISSHEETDDATITGHIHTVSSRIAGNVEQVLVDDNQHVSKGQVLAVLDPSDYSVQVDQMKAQLALAQGQAAVSKSKVAEAIEASKAQSSRADGDISASLASLASYKMGVIEAEAGVSAAKQHLVETQATLDKAQIDYKRYAYLQQQGAVPTQLLDSARRDLSIARANVSAAQDAISQSQARLAAAKDAVAQAQAHTVSMQSERHEAKASELQIQSATDQFESDMAAVEAARAKLANAELQNSYTKIVAPVSGTIGRKALEVGQHLQPGQQILAIIPDDLWVVANFKETQLEKMKNGQTVEVKVDAFPHHVFMGHVDSVSPASGSEFALLPPDNATGNFTKIVQRIPVKISLDRNSIAGFENRLAPGMSVIATVDLQHKS